MTQEEINRLIALRDDWKSTGNRAWKEIEENFPEVFESKDEKIRKAILNHIRMYSKINGVKSFDNVSTEGIIGYLERKKEPTDEEMIRTLRLEYEKGVADTIAKYEQKTAVPTNLSDDDRIREMLIKYFKELKVDSFINLEIPDILVWLEKQKEQKPENYDHEMWKNCEANFEGGKKEVIDNPEKYGLCKKAEWSYPYGKNETVDQLIAIAECLEMDGDCSFNGYKGEDCGKFLRELARRESENKPAEWSEEDEWKLNEIIKYLEDKGDYRSCWVSFLKDLPNRFSLRPSWRPTDEQYYALRDAIIKLDADDSDARFPWKDLPILHLLRNDLEKLRK